MKRMAPLILTFFVYTFVYAQHISEFTSLAGLGQDSNFNLPPTHTFQVLIEKGDGLDIGGQLPGNLDFAGYVPVQGSSKFGYLSINSELVPKGAVTILDIEFDDEIGKWMVSKSQAVDFSFEIPAENPENTGNVDYKVGSTVANCSGTVTPWNTIITCEEWTNKDILNRIPGLDESLIKVDGEVTGYNGYGWAIEIDPATKTVIDQEGGRENSQDKLWAMGNFKHENAVIHSNNRTVYQGADDTNGEGYLFKFVATNEKDLSQGSLYVYKGDKDSTHNWVLLQNSTPAQQNSTLSQCAVLGATNFGGIEDVEINPIDGMVYFAVKRESNLEFTGKGVIYRFKDTDPLDDSGITNFEIYAGGNSVYDGVAWGNGTDNLVFDDLGNLWVAQDGDLGNSDLNKRDYNYIWVVENGHTELNPKIKIFARTPKGSEPTGLTFSPDYRYIFMSIQHPKSNDSDQTDVFGRSVSFNNDVVLVIARNEHLGKDLTLEDQDIMISQYYHDEASDSKWIEIKNISGDDIPVGTYFIDLYDSADLANIASTDPKASDTIPAMAPGEVRLFKNKENPNFPQSGYLGDAIQKQSDVCNFDGDDIILITTTPGSRKYINRKDILGNTTMTQWGLNNSLIRGGNFPELPERDFDLNNWIELDSLQEVNQTNKLKNIALGTHVIGPAVWNGASWDNNSPPDRTRNTEIIGDYIGGQEDFAAYDLKINDGGSLKFEDNNVGSNNDVIVQRNLTIHPNGSLIIGDTESLIIKNAAAIVTGDMEKIEKSTKRNHHNDITYWSSPVQDEQIEGVFPDIDPDRIFYYDQSKYVSDETYWDVWQKASGNMNVGQGYAAEGPIGEIGEHVISFTGTPNYGPISTSDMYFNDDEGANEDMDNDFNLIGNPYPSAIDIESFLDTNDKISGNGVIDGTIYLWTHATEIADTGYSNSDYVTYNNVGAVAIDEDIEVSRNIGSAQGFFVRALKTAPVVFDQSMILLNANNQFFKRSKEKNAVEKDRMWVNLKGSDNSFKQILIGFDEKASDEMDSGYDAIYLDGGRSSGFYSLLNERKLAIQGMGTFEPSKTIELGFEVKTEGITMTIEIDRTEGVLNEAEIILVDHELSVMHNLKEKAYHFNYDAKGEFLGRFSIGFNAAIFLNEDTFVSENINIYVQDENLFVDSPKEINDIKIFDILGRKLISEQPESKSFELSLNEFEKGSLFIVKIKGINGFELTRKMIKY